MNAWVNILCILIERWPQHHLVWEKATRCRLCVKHMTLMNEDNVLKKISLMGLMLTCTTLALAAPSYTVKLTGKTNLPSEDTLSFQTNKGWKDVYYFGLDKKSEAALERAIKQKSCVRLTENANDREMHKGFVIRTAPCRK